MQCPHCQADNPEFTRRCDCGYDFDTGRKQENWNWLWWVVVWLVPIPIPASWLPPWYVFVSGAFLFMGLWVFLAWKASPR